MLASYDAESGRMRIVPVAAGRAQEKSLELWLVPGQGDPFSLGILPADTGGELVIPSDLRDRLSGGATLAVSLEPFGGSPTGKRPERSWRAARQEASELSLSGAMRLRDCTRHLFGSEMGYSVAASLRTEAWRRKCATGLACLYGFVGTIAPSVADAISEITPDWVPSPHLVILLTGLCEIAGAVGIVTARFQRAAGIGLALYAVCVFPANIKHAIDALSGEPSVWEWIYHLLRLPLQPVLICLPLFAGRGVRWPKQER